MAKAMTEDGGHATVLYVYSTMPYYVYSYNVLSSLKAEGRSLPSQAAMKRGISGEKKQEEKRREERGTNERRKNKAHEQEWP